MCWWIGPCCGVGCVKPCFVMLMLFLVRVGSSWCVDCVFLLVCWRCSSYCVIFVQFSLCVGGEIIVVCW